MAKSRDIVRVEVRSKYPHRTWFVWVEAPADRQPEALFAALREAGYEEQPAAPPDAHSRIAKTYARPGSGLFGGWSEDELMVWLPSLYALLDGHGFNGFSERRLTAADLI